MLSLARMRALLDPGQPVWGFVAHRRADRRVHRESEEGAVSHSVRNAAYVLFPRVEMVKLKIVWF